ncbi:hypothetical protein LINGRAHAP2_LOCUS34590 [Linum grandiflorum]
MHLLQENLHSCVHQWYFSFKNTQK